MARWTPLRAVPVVAAGLLLLVGCGPRSQPAAPAAAATPVRLAHPLRFTKGRSIEAIGRLEAMDEAQLGFVTAGVLRRVNVDIGDRYKAGAVLAELDTTALDAGLRQAKEQADQARRDLARTQALVIRQLLPAQQLDDAKTHLQVADAAVRSAGFQRRYGEVVASADGVVTGRLAQPGEVLAAGQPVLRISSARQGWRMKVEVADRDAVQLVAGAPASVRCDAFPGQALRARIREVGGRAAAGSGAITLDLELEPATLPLRSGLIGRARVSLPATAVLGIPVSAIVSARDDRAQVWVARGGRAERRTITLGELRGDRVEVTAGLGDGDAVVVEGGAWVDADTPIQPNRLP